MNRRTFLTSILSGSMASVTGCAAPRDDSTQISLDPVVKGLRQPLDAVFPNGLDRIYIATRPGQVFVFENGTLLDEPLVDLSDKIVLANERGLLGIELHPNFARNRRLFVRYSSPRRDGTPETYSHTFVLSEFTVNEAGTKAPVRTERTILEIPEPQGVHNSGDIVFGPEGYLYVPTGDGGAHNDIGRGHAEDWYQRNLGGNGQDVAENLLGSILRIDVDRSETIRGERRPYGIPTDNPLVDTDGLGEQFAWGFRNPWRTSFDGDTYLVGDVGQALYEEVNHVKRGGNYGWNVMEGRACFNSFDNNEPFNNCPGETPDSIRGGEPLREPLIQYPNEEPVSSRVNGLAVVGGYVYRGAELPALEGRYIFGDFRPMDRLFVATRNQSDQKDHWASKPLPINNSSSIGFKQLLSFGRDSNDELYVLGNNGLFRIVSA